tara:strand:- start:9336 stop:9713 length:378 start_codon:yes stop_codon:yes gene_type:complete
MGIMQSAVTEVANNMGTVAPEIENPEEQDIREPRSPEDWVSMDIGYGIESKYEVHDMYNTVKILKLEEWIKNTKWSDIRRSKESNMISKGLENNNHSGASYGSCLWITKEVFEKGWYPKYSIHAN